VLFYTAGQAERIIERLCGLAGLDVGQAGQSTGCWSAAACNGMAAAPTGSIV
jgi:hypothetical protein